MVTSRHRFVGFVGGLLAAGGVWLALHHRSDALHPPDPPALLERVREVARLETLEVTVWKKVEFDPDPVAKSSVFADLREWVHFTVDPPKGKAIVFARGYLGLDLARLDANAMKVEEAGVMVVTLPPIVTRVELEPAETEVVRSNLDTEETDLLLARAKDEIEADLGRDPRLHARAVGSAERSLRLLFLEAGYADVRFVGDHAGNT